MSDLPAGTVTFLLTDIEGSTRLWEEHPEAMRATLVRHDALMATGIARHGGVVVKHRGEGDSLFAVFSRATDAAAAACALQLALVTEAWPTALPLRVRMALHTGEAELREGDYYGPAVNRCARLRAAAHGGQVLLSLATEEVTRDALPAGVSLQDLGSCRLRDLHRAEQVFQLLHPELPFDFPALHSLDARPNNLPQQVTSFIGRAAEMARVKELLGTTRLLTITGSGGTGKSRLAVQIAADLLEHYGDGVWLVELAPLSDPTLVLNVMAAALGVKEQPDVSLETTLLGYLHAKRLLLLLDNCEHLLPVCAALAEIILRDCPGTAILATSREGLNIPGETTYRLPSLSVPDTGLPLPVETLVQYEAVRLFLDRASAARPGFTATRENGPALAQVCRRLDGIPLALELAAARMRALPVEKLAERLDDRFRLLTGGSRTALPRQQTLRALIDWSYELLSEPERALFRRLSVFAGGWSLEAAEGVCGCMGVWVYGGEDSPTPTPTHPHTYTPTHPSPPTDRHTHTPIHQHEVLDLLASLVSKSLVVYDESGDRYRLLETVRQYAQERLEEQRETEALRRRHLEYFLSRVAGSGLRTTRTTDLNRLDLDYDNFRTALEWGLTTEAHAEAACRLICALNWYWVIRGYHTEGRSYAERALALCDWLSDAMRARILAVTSDLAFFQQENERARSLGQEAVAGARAAGDGEGLAAALFYLARTDLGTDTATARSLLEESAALYRELGDRSGLGWVLAHLGEVAIIREELPTARSLLQESLTIFGDSQEEVATALVVGILGSLACKEGELGEARSLFEESLRLRRQAGDHPGAEWVLFKLTLMEHGHGNYAAAGAACEEMLALQGQRGWRRWFGFAHQVLGDAARVEGDYPRAAAHYEECLAALPAEPQTLNNLAWSLVDPRLGTPDPRYIPIALAAARRADEAVQGGSGAIVNTLARVYFVSGDAAKALATQQRAVALAAGTPLSDDPQFEQRLVEYQNAMEK